MFCGGPNRLVGGLGPTGPYGSYGPANILEFIIYSYEIEVSDYKSDLGFCNRGYVSEIFKFIRIRLTIAIEKLYHYYSSEYRT